VRRVLSFLALGSALVLGAVTAAGQPKPTAPSASAAAPAAPSGAPQEALPPGHPPVGEALPAGHPPVNGNDSGDEDDDAPPNPHAGRGGHAADPRFFTPPEDTAADDPSLPPGTIVVTIKDAKDAPVPHAPITLGVLHASVAKGESDEHLAHDGDEGGSARFDHLAFGPGHTYRVSTTRGPAQFSEMPFALSDRGGKRVTLHSYEVSGSLDDLRVYMKGEVDVALREGDIVVEQPIGVLNIGEVAWVANAPIALPKGFKAFNKQESMDDTRVEEVPGSGAAIQGTFPPGQRGLHFRYQVPLDGEATQTMHVGLPPRMMQVRVIAEASRAMTLAVAGFPPAQRVEGRDGKKYLITEQQPSQAMPDISSLAITLSGLPTQGPGRWIAVALAVLVFGAGIFYVLQSADGAVDGDARQDLIEAREALLDEIVALERAHKSGEVGPKTYDRVHAALLDARAHRHHDRPRAIRKEAGRRPRRGPRSRWGRKRPQTPVPLRGPQLAKDGATHVKAPQRFARLELTDGRRVFAALEGGRALLLDGAPWVAGAPTGEVVDGVDDEAQSSAARRLAPVLPAKILCVGRNYKAHASELGSEVPVEPLLFFKPTSSLLDPDGTIELPPPSISSRVDHEAELGVILGRRARRVSVEEAAACIFGCTVVGDITARDLQKKDGQWARAKGMDTFCPTGPVVVTGLDPQALSIACRVNGELRQSGWTRDMIFSVASVIAYASQVMTLEPGDLLVTGTPSGVGPLHDGDRLEIEVPGIGALRARVAAAA
jgi:2-keto-4-pentenoate hydratase/2-oxohepta-3-ene-1,7-dioic acid hydratase in catechol pathway